MTYQWSVAELLMGEDCAVPVQPSSEVVYLRGRLIRYLCAESDHLHRLLRVIRMPVLQTLGVRIAVCVLQRTAGGTVPPAWFTFMEVSGRGQGRPTTPSLSTSL